ncbi:hypothetical protein E4U13_001292 [Claviceps humidiphila]|uniref:Zn(2)-C6 fungal-type domain-containing protein n=1 Tax=Claviceps humidiphila TaxID=1294629 RepID=A0A9P7Q849_9HYPO|nr:hypothetical protein E4U13_001292 [Claviceps humidiphila]
MDGTIPPFETNQPYSAQVPLIMDGAIPPREMNQPFSARVPLIMDRAFPQANQPFLAQAPLIMDEAIPPRETNQPNSEQAELIMDRSFPQENQPFLAQAPLIMDEAMPPRETNQPFSARVPLIMDRAIPQANQPFLAQAPLIMDAAIPPRETNQPYSDQGQLIMDGAIPPRETNQPYSDQGQLIMDGAISSREMNQPCSDQARLIMDGSIPQANQPFSAQVPLIMDIAIPQANQPFLAQAPLIMDEAIPPREMNQPYSDQAELIMDGAIPPHEVNQQYSAQAPLMMDYGMIQPYSSEQHSVTNPSFQQTIPDLGLLNTGPALFEEALTQITPSLAQFAHTGSLQPQRNFVEDSFLCDQNLGSSLFLPDALMNMDPGSNTSAFLVPGGSSHLAQSYLDYNTGVLFDMGANMISSNRGIGVNSMPMPMLAGLPQAGPQQSWTNAVSHFQQPYQQFYPQSSFDFLLPSQRGGKRGPFRDPTLREQTALTRKIGSCIRCRMQRIRCERNPNETGGPCLTCLKVVNAKAGKFPCLRYKITDIKLFKSGQVPGFEWTQRWANNIADPIQKWASTEIKVIHISTTYSKKTIELQVRQFVPLEGDKLERTWVHQGTKKSVTVPPYALMDLDAGKKAYLKHIYASMGDTLQLVAERSRGLVRMTYIQAFRVYRDPAIPEDWKQLLDWTFRLWMSVRLSTTSDFIVGEEKLGMADDILDETHPNPGRIPVPPVLGAQLDLVMIHQIQVRLRHEVLDKLQKMVLKNKPDTWFVTYLVLFLLLHNAALITAHDASYARKHGILSRFARIDRVAAYQLGANILLAHFHYCNKGWYPFSDKCKEQDLRTLADLSDDRVKFVQETRRIAKANAPRWGRLRESGASENDYYFVSQLFEEDWHPRRV